MADMEWVDKIEVLVNKYGYHGPLHEGVRKLIAAVRLANKRAKASRQALTWDIDSRTMPSAETPSADMILLDLLARLRSGNVEEE